MTILSRDLTIRKTDKGQCHTTQTAFHKQYHRHTRCKCARSHYAHVNRVSCSSIHSFLHTTHWNVHLCVFDLKSVAVTVSRQGSYIIKHLSVLMFLVHVVFQSELVFSIEHDVGDSGGIIFQNV